MPITPRRRRLLSLATAATLTLGLPAAGASILAGPAQSAAPAADCAEAFPIEELTAGDAVTGLTVVRGTTPTSFTGEVLGVLEDGIGPDVDMIMIDLEMPEFAATGGVWQGMSGSPVYAQDGRLIGAVAYGLANGPSPIAGITPYAEMDDYLAPAGSTVRSTPKRLDADDARTVAERAGISTARASGGFRELPMPLGITGLTPRRLAQLQADLPGFVERSSYVMGRASAAAAGPETIVAGGNIGASVAYGDVSMAGVGTATSVCDGRVVGFGHPLALLGATTESLHPAEAVYVQPDSLGSPFKVTNLAPPVGTVDSDRLTGITGAFGDLPETTRVTSEVTYGSRSRTGTTGVTVPDFTAEATFYQLVANQDRVVDGPSVGSELLTWTISGSEQGTPYTLTYTDRWTGDDLTSEPSYGIAGIIETLLSLDGVTVQTVDVTTDVTDSLKRHTLAGVEQRRGGVGGRWVRVTQNAPAVALPGKAIQLRLVLGGTAGRTTRALKPIVMARQARGELLLVAQGGQDDDYYSFFPGEDEGGEFGFSPESPTVADLRAVFTQQARHDQVSVQVGTLDRVEHEYDEEDEYFRSSRGVSFLRTQRTSPASHVIGGLQVLPVVVR